MYYPFNSGRKKKRRPELLMTMRRKRADAYDEEFYSETYAKTSTASARVVVPEVLALLSPNSVIDVGCGQGSWLSVFAELGVRNVYGVDGDHVRRDRLLIPAAHFSTHDLSKQLERQDTFSLVMSLEVAEHLPADCAETFVRSLTGLGKVVLFSAAVPFQTGTHHVNLQWQDYWIDLFAARGYVAVDAIRPVIWQNASVSFWYRQNMLFFVEKDHLQSQPALMRAWERTHHGQLSVVHPTFLTILGRGISAEQFDSLHLRQVIPRLPRMLVDAVVRRIRLLGTNRKNPTKD